MGLAKKPLALDFGTALRVCECVLERFSLCLGNLVLI